MYAPIADSSEDYLVVFYNEIDQFKKYIKSTDINIFLGDWNAKVGAEKVEHIVRPYELGTRNDRGTRFVEFGE